jgi:HAD superfamily hydrolase (TIGR01490 family)
VSSNVVHQYAWFARRSGSRWRQLKLAADLPRLGYLELRSRRRFNEVFFRHYRGFRQDWLASQSEALFDELLRPAMFTSSEPLAERCRREGYSLILVTGSLDFAVAPLAAHLGFLRVVANRLVFDDGVATGALDPPVIAEAAKVRGMRALMAEYGVEPSNCRAYSDSMSDLPMLEAVGNPIAVNPGSRLTKIALERNWTVLRVK